MLTTQQQRASDLIWGLWQRGEVAADLPSDLKPRSRAEGYAIQAGLDARSTRPRAGWKIAATSTAGQSHIGVDGPLAGRIPAEVVHRAGAVVSVASNRMRVAEPEFVFRLGRALPPRSRPYAVDEVMAAVEALHLGIELPDSRFSDFARVGGPALIADDACARDLVVGEAVAADWRKIDLTHHAVKGFSRSARGETLERDGIGANVLGDPRIALAWIANELSEHGVGLAAGEFVTTGTCMVPLAITSGDHVRADFGALGEIEVSVI
jgi:2-keto-4-pentenoate hydratase